MEPTSKLNKASLSSHLLSIDLKVILTSFPFPGRKQQVRPIVRPRGPSSRFEGVFCDKSGKWVAQLAVGGKHHYVGSFASEDEAGFALGKAQASMVASGPLPHNVPTLSSISNPNSIPLISPTPSFGEIQSEIKHEAHEKITG